MLIFRTKKKKEPIFLSICGKLKYLGLIEFFTMSDSKLFYLSRTPNKNTMLRINYKYIKHQFRIRKVNYYFVNSYESYTTYFWRKTINIESLNLDKFKALSFKKKFYMITRMIPIKQNLSDNMALNNLLEKHYEHIRRHDFKILKKYKYKYYIDQPFY